MFIQHYNIQFLCLLHLLSPFAATTPLALLLLQKLIAGLFNIFPNFIDFFHSVPK